MRCCANCFGDRGLKRDIIPSLSSEQGRCSYCLSEGVALVAPLMLAEYFGPLINIYEPDVRGELLVEWLRVDWAMFDHASMDTQRAKGLLADVLDDGEIVRQLFSPPARFQSDALNRWEQLRDELMYKNRYFPDTQIDSGRFEELLVHLAD
jgi:hypothetical protein